MNAAEQFKSVMRAEGLQPPDIIEPGRLHRFSTNGRRSDSSGWCRLFEDELGGVFGDWRSGKEQTWQANAVHQQTPAEREAFRRKVEEDRLRRKQEADQKHQAAADQAAEYWKRCQDAISHPYLERKGIKAHGGRIYKGPLSISGTRCDGSLVIPLRNKDGEIRSLQFITGDGTKLYLPNGEKSGCYFSIGKPEGVICIVEGYATGASVHEATNHAVAIAFDAAGLLPVAEVMREKFPDATLIVCADNDQFTPGNPGVTKARAAADAVGGLLAIPKFSDLESRPTDFNDQHRQDGLEAVRAALDSAAPVTFVENMEAPEAAQSGPEGGVSAVTAVPHQGHSQNWGIPKPIQAPLLSVEAFDAVGLLPATLRDWVMDEADRMPCPPDFVAASALVGLGAVIGARCAIKPKAKDDWLVIPNLWGGVVGLPSAKKSPAIGGGLRHLDRLIADEMSAYQDRAEEYECSKTICEAKKDAIEARIKAAAKAKGETPERLEDLAKELKDFQTSQDKPPTLRRFKTNDSTVEKLGELLRENPNGLLVLRDELVGLIASWDREGREGERAFFLEGWNGNASFDTDRIGRGSIFIENLCLNIFGGIQPDKLTSYLEQATHALANDGMLQRFQVLVYPDQTGWEWRDRAPSKQARDKAYEIFRTLAHFDPVTWGAAEKSEYAKFPCFSFDNEAQATFIEWSTELHQERLLKEESPIVQQHLAKFDKLFPSIALILHLVDCAATGARGPVTNKAACMAAAWCQYLESHARRCYGLIQDDGLRSAIALSQKVQQGKLENGFTARDVRRNQWRYLTTDEAVRAALDWLEGDNWIRKTEAEPKEYGGRPTVEYQINPAFRGAA